MNTTIIPSHIRNLIFDLGGVIINLSLQKTYEAFSKISGVHPKEIVTILSQSKELLAYETGMMTDSEFRNFIRNKTQKMISDTQIDEAWNALLQDIPKERLSILKKLKNQYRTFLLSNTNSIHHHAFNIILQNNSDNRHTNFDSYFDRVYYSHTSHIRKPDQAFYQHVIEQNKINPSQTLFFDDTIDNLAGAKAVGITTFHVTNADELFKKLDGSK